MKHIIKFLDYYRDIYGSFKNFPEIKHYDDNGLHYKTNKEYEIELTSLAIAELFLYEKFDFVLGEKEPQTKRLSKKLSQELYQKYSSEKLDPFKSLDLLLSKEPNYILENILSLESNDIQIHFSQDFSTYQFDYKKLEKIKEFESLQDPYLLVKAYETLVSIKPGEYEENSHKLKLFSDIFSHTINKDQYFYKSTKEKYSYLHNYIDEIFNYPYDFENEVFQNKSDFKQTMLTSFLYYFPKFFHDINSKEMIRNGEYYIDLISKQNFNNFINYIENHEYNPWVCIKNISDRFSPFSVLHIHSPASFLYNEKEKENDINYPALKENLNLKYFYIIDKKNDSNLGKPLNQSLIVEQNEYSIYNFEKIIHYYIENTIPLEKVTVELLNEYIDQISEPDVYGNKKLYLEHSFGSRIEFDTMIKIIRFLDNLILYEDHLNLKENLIDPKTNLNYFYSEIFLNYQDYSKEHQLIIMQLFDVGNKHIASNDFIIISKRALETIKKSFEHDHNVMNSFLAEKEMLINIPPAKSKTQYHKF